MKNREEVKTQIYIIFKQKQIREKCIAMHVNPEQLRWLSYQNHFEHFGLFSGLISLYILYRNYNFHIPPLHTFKPGSPDLLS